MSSSYHARDAISEQRHTTHRTTTTTFSTTQSRAYPRHGNVNPPSASDHHHSYNFADSIPASNSPPVPVDTFNPSSGNIEWNVVASLIAHSTAPLAGRVSVPPRAGDAPPALRPSTLQDTPLDVQEKLIIDDLLFVLMGFEGQYIHYSQSYNPQVEKDRLVGPEFKVQPGLDPSLRDLIAPMLATASHYIALDAFVEVQSRDEYGAVNHALCAAVRGLLTEYLSLIVQLEKEKLTKANFTLHLFSLHMKTASHLLAQLYSVAIELLKANSVLEDVMDDDSIDDTENLDDIIESLREGGTPMPGKKTCKGGSVIGLITRRLSAISGDPGAKKLLMTLIREASKPYMKMLNEWLHHGCINDPHNEFLIKEQKSIRREKLDQDYTDEYWEKRYTLRENLVPPQLESVRDKVLLAGKYLNVVRECGGVDVSKDRADVPASFDDPRFLENVNSAYAHANSSLLSLLFTTHALPARLRSLKHYFFLDRSDFFSYFLDLGASELRKPARSVNLGKLQTLLDIVLRQPGSVAAEDPYKEDVKVQMNEHSLTDWLMKIVNVTGMDQDAAAAGNLSGYIAPIAQQPTGNADNKEIIGFDALVLDYSMPFPLSLVVSRVTLTRYQLLFRYLLSLRHLETLLSNSWLEHSQSLSWKHKSPDKRIEVWKRRAWTLRARMMVFVQQLLYYCTAEVIEPNWQSLMSRLESGRVPFGGSRAQEPGPNAVNSFSAMAVDHPDSVSAMSPPGKLGQQQVKRTVDELMQDHVDFLATCLKECMLTNSKLLKINSKILATCTMFANYTTSLSRYLIAVDEELAQPASSGLASGTRSTTTPAPTSANGTNNPASTNSNNVVYDPEKLSKLMDLLHRYEDNFSRHLKLLLEMLNYLAATETVVFLSLCSRLSTASEGFSRTGV